VPPAADGFSGRKPPAGRRFGCVRGGRRLSGPPASQTGRATADRRNWFLLTETPCRCGYTLDRRPGGPPPLTALTATPLGTRLQEQTV
jgi:hypothetical protein